MRIYHFCSRHDVRGIKTDGITKGMIPSVKVETNPQGKRTETLVLYDGWQWLTMDGDHGRQSWATREVFKDDRTEYRLTIEIPEKELDCIYDRERLLKVYPEIGPLFEGWDGSENWRVYRGKIPKYWIKTIDHWSGEKWENGKWIAGEWQIMPWR